MNGKSRIVLCLQGKRIKTHANKHAMWKISWSVHLTQRFIVRKMAPSQFLGSRDRLWQSRRCSPIGLRFGSPS